MVRSAIVLLARSIRFFSACRRVEWEIFKLMILRLRHASVGSPLIHFSVDVTSAHCLGSGACYLVNALDEFLESVHIVSHNNF